MCGIAGIFSLSLSNKEKQERTEQMLSTIRHRGPDNSSIWQNDTAVSLGHNRLSIIDLSDTANQPFHYHHLSIVFNGELYNYIEIKKELETRNYKFTTKSDTEVLLAAYLEWGEDCVTHFMGMWAFALWDDKNQKLFCSRDRFGIKPFYYAWIDSSFYFASEYKALKILPNFNSTLNINQLYRGIQMGWVTYQDETYFESIKQIEPSHNLTLFLDGRKTYKKYWDIDFSKKFEGTHEDKTQAFKEAIIDSIQLHLRSDVVVGACLSGGLDSSTIASVIGKFNPKTDLNTFTVFYDGQNDVDERPFAKLVTDLYPSLKPHYLMPNEKSLIDDFEKIQFHQDIPLPGSSPISQYYVMKLAKEHKAIVLLDGQGSDEFLAGYLHSFYRLIGEQVYSLNPLHGFRTWSQFSKIQEFDSKEKYIRLAKSLASGIFSEDVLYQQEYKNAFPFLPNVRTEVFSLEKKNTSKLNEFLYNLIFTSSLPTLLHFEDRNSMAFSIESRVPFLDHRLVELAFSLPDTDKISKGITKSILRESMQGILPNDIVNRMDKKGFVTPGEVKWLRGPLHFLLNDMDYSNLNMLNTKQCKKIIDDYNKGDNSNAKIVWRLATLNLWLKNKI